MVKMLRSGVIPLLIASLASGAAASQRPAGPAPIEEQVVFASGGGRKLAGTLTFPTVGKAPFPLAVTVTGSGPHFRDGNRTKAHPYRPFRDIATALALAGVATLRLDDRGVGESTGDANAATGADTADDTRAAVLWLRGRPEIDPSRIALIGHSLGGEIAPIVASDDPRVAALVLMGAPARNFRETMRYQHRYRIESDPAIPPASRAPALAEAMRQQEVNVAASVEKWRQWAQDLDPLVAVRQVRCPVLILHGLTDRAVPPEDARILERALREASNRRVTVRLFEQVNHHFQRDPVGAREGYDRLKDQKVAPEVLKTLSDWLANTLRSATR